MSEYQKQANDFLAATKTTFTARFKANDFYFNDDKETRDIFSCTLKNDRHRFTFKFGQSINNSTGSGDNKPTAYDVLACLQKYDPGTFENFCSDFGYDTDSRSAYKTYKSVMREWKNVEKLFTTEEIEQLQEIN